MNLDNHELSFDCVIPSAIFFNENLEPAAIKCYAIIRNLTKMNGYCFATNKYLAKILEAGERTVKTWISSLEEEGYLEIEHIITGIQDQRHIYLADNFKKCLRRAKNGPPPGQKWPTPGPKMAHIIEDNIYKEDKTKNISSGVQEKKKFSVPNAEALGLANLLEKAIKITKSDIKTPQIEKWAEELERCIRIDKRDPITLGKIIGWLPTSGFWSKNILSAEKLRKQFDRLELEMATEKPKKQAVLAKNKTTFNNDPTFIWTEMRDLEKAGKSVPKEILDLLTTEQKERYERWKQGKLYA